MKHEMVHGAMLGGGHDETPPAATAGHAAAPCHDAAVQHRVRELERIYREIETTRMAGLGITHPKLEVAAVDFAAEPTGGAAGVLITPWFMNLVWLPEAEADRRCTDDREAPGRPTLGIGVSRARSIGCEVIDFLGAHEAGFGPFETCSLFSPMFDFVDQAAAVATAREVLRLLRQPVDPAAAPGRAASLGEDAPAGPGGRAAPAASRRAFLLGRQSA
ncbi:MAG: [NiFe]-hydrogenase assembly chaperone HybE [Rubrivivax sp.]|nr:[NiFe]-hydrogenase assembly chaperone HybE [Rubrivivax sp.]